MQKGRTSNKITMDRFTLQIENYRANVFPFDWRLLKGCIIGFVICLIVIGSEQAFVTEMADTNEQEEQFVDEFRFDFFAPFRGSDPPTDDYVMKIK